MRKDDLVDGGLAALSAALLTLQIATEDAFAGERGTALAIGLGFSLALAWRRRAPIVPLLAGLALIALSNRTVPALGNTGTFFVGYVLAIYAAGRYSDSPAVAALTLAVAFPLAADEPGQPFSVSDAAFIAVAFAGPFIAGRAIRRRHERELHLHGELDQVVADERARIARELHDVVAHAISVIVLQARGGRRKLPEDAQESREAFDAIERSGEQALSEMRRLLDMLRHADEQLALTPQPSLSRLDDLLAGLRASGLPVELRIEGEPVALPPGVDVSAYRIVQEALTNALKHAGPARAQVTLRYSAASLELEIADDGQGSADGPGTGHGLAGLRERVAVYGGELESGRRSGGGYALRARLPLSAR